MTPRPDQVKRGEVFRYHPVIGSQGYVRVRIMREPYELASGDWVCKATRLTDNHTVYPSVEALSEDHDPQT